MTPLYHEFIAWLADYYLLASVLLLFAAIAHVTLKQPAKRRAVTQSTLIGLVLLAVLCAASGLVVGKFDVAVLNYSRREPGRIGRC